MLKVKEYLDKYFRCDADDGLVEQNGDIGILGCWIFPKCFHMETSDEQVLMVMVIIEEVLKTRL